MSTMHSDSMTVFATSVIFWIPCYNDIVDATVNVIAHSYDICKDSWLLSFFEKKRIQIPTECVKKFKAILCFCIWPSKLQRTAIRQENLGWEPAVQHSNTRKQHWFVYIRRIWAVPNEQETESSGASSKASAARPPFFETFRLYTNGRLKPLSVVAFR